MEIRNNPIYIDMKEYIEENTEKIPYSRFNMVSYAIGKYGSHLRGNIQMHHATV